MKRFFPGIFAILASCGLFEPPPEPTAPFIFVELSAPDGFPIPDVDNLEVTTSALVDGNLISDVIPIPLGDNELPTSFAITFSEGIRGTNIEIAVRGFGVGGDLMSGSGRAVANASTLAIVGHFCGDGATNPDRQEGCDDGLENSDTTPNACRTDCTAPGCGDGVIDDGEVCDDGVLNSDTVADTCRSTCALPTCGDGATDTGEECDDDNNTDADGCEADCSLPACGNGILDPEDFEGATCYELTATPVITAGRDIAAADIDEDGLPDLVHVDTGANALKIEFGDGQGNFPQTVTVPLNSNASFVEFGKLGGNEGPTDIAVFGFDTKVVVVRHTGPRTFAVVNTQNLSSTIFDVTVADLNNDNRDDLVAVTSDGVFRFSQDSGSNFGSPVSVNIPNSLRFGQIESKDMNSDGRIDLTILENINFGESAKLIIANNIGNNNFSFSSLDVPGISVDLDSDVDGLAIFDRNNDGEFEIAIVDRDSINSSIVLTNNMIPISAELLLTSEPIDVVFSGDIDLDGNDDLIMRNQNLFIHLSSNNFQEQLVATNLFGFFPIFPFDFNQDGILDIIIRGASTVTFNE